MPNIGDLRVNPNTFMSEVWDGKFWTTSPAMAIAPSTYSTITANVTIGASTISSARPTISATERELIFNYIKDNIRVAEYHDKHTGKIDTVQLEMRLDQGYVWEAVQRIKIK